MKAKSEENFEMKDEYDFSKGVRGAYTQSFRDLNLVSLDDDVKAAFPDSTAVNAALRNLMTGKSHSVETAEVDALQKAS